MSRIRLGDLEILLLSDGTFLLDAGAMFGIVPKPLWNREVPCDEKNRMLLRCNCPLILAGREKILIDCGLGRKWNQKQREIYGIGPGPTLLDDLRRHGIGPEEVTVLAQTHLHLDHAGWLSQRTSADGLEPVFVNARVLVERRELEVARAPNELQRGTYLKENLEPIERAKGFEVFDDSIRIAPGVTMFRTGGHTAGHCCLRLESGGKKAIFIGEMMPTVAHRHLPWVMAYDSYPLETLEAKRRLQQEALREDALLLLDHDPNHFAVRLREVQPGRLETLTVPGE